MFGIGVGRGCGCEDATGINRGGRKGILRCSRGGAAHGVCRGGAVRVPVVVGGVGVRCSCATGEAEDRGQNHCNGRVNGKEGVE